MIKIPAIVFTLAIIGLVGLAASQPDTFVVERALRMKAPPEQVFTLISNFEHWAAWSPWVAKDPQIEIMLSEQTSGMGARYEWAGDANVGRGRMEIVRVMPPESVRLKLSIFEPMLATNMVDFVLTPFGDYTKVTWTMRGPMDFKMKLMSVFTAMDDRVGPDFALGLGRLKALAER
ncbi:MAG: SRPBCC family protein [Gammaproteobacteria bacterium]|jgi:uncharacterized protein YndB with AHSA1/START domain